MGGHVRGGRGPRRSERDVHGADDSIGWVVYRVGRSDANDTNDEYEFTKFIELSRLVFSARTVHCVVSCALARMRFQL